MWIFDISNQTIEQNVKALSVFSPEEVNKIGRLPTEAIAGFIIGENSSISVDNFCDNKVFVNFMHNVISTEALKDLSIQQAAAEQQEGWLYIIDNRVADNEEEIFPEDIIGAFEVNNGQIVINSYQPNDNYLIFGNNGLIQLPGSLHEALIKALLSLPD